MKTQILYVELKSGYNDNGPAWIGNGFFSKSGRTIYFNGKVFKKGNGISGNHVDIEKGEEYWISGVKLDGSDRHWAGSGTIQIDESIIPDYLKIIGQTVLQKNKFQVVHLDNVPAKHIATEIENQKLEPDFDFSLMYKNSCYLSDKELAELLIYYRSLDLTNMYKKGRKEFLLKINSLESELENRQNKNYA